MVQHGVVETLQLSTQTVFLVFLINRRYSRMLKGNFVFQCLLYEECLSNTAPAIYCNKLWAVAMVEPVQLLDFFFLPTMVLIIALICRKVVKITQTAK